MTFTEHAKEFFDPAAVATLPDEIKPTMKDAWAAFRAAAPHRTIAEIERFWLVTVDYVRNVRGHIARLQIDFKEDDWQTVIDVVRGSGFGGREAVRQCGDGARQCGDAALGVATSRG